MPSPYHSPSSKRSTDAPRRSSVASTLLWRLLALCVPASSFIDQNPASKLHHNKPFFICAMVVLIFFHGKKWQVTRFYGTSFQISTGQVPSCVEFGNCTQLLRLELMQWCWRLARDIPHENVAVLLVHTSLIIKISWADIIKVYLKLNHEDNFSPPSNMCHSEHSTIDY